MEMEPELEEIDDESSDEEELEFTDSDLDLEHILAVVATNRRHASAV